MRWFRRPAKPAKPRAAQSRLRIESLEGREVPAVGVLPQFWYLSSTWAAGAVLAPPVVTPPPPPPTGGTGGTGGTGQTPTPPVTPTFDLATASDTGTVGDKITGLSSVTLTGTTSPRAAVRLVQTGAVVMADATGKFQFTNVPLVSGANNLTVRAQTAGGRASASNTFNRQSAPTVKTALAPVSVAASASKTIDLAGTFDDADISNTKVRLVTSEGTVNIELFDKQAPKTVANFLNYLQSGKYTDSIFHRSVPGFVLQGGGFQFTNGATPGLTAIPTDPPVQNEPDPVNRSNLRGTLAMAKLGGDPNSATDQFFFNLGNNAANLDSQNGGFTVFGKVVSAADQAVVDKLAALPTQNEGSAPGLPASEQGVFTNIPLKNYTGSSATFPGDTTAANFAAITGATIVSQTEALTYTVVGNTDATVATATVTNNRLTVQGVKAGSTTLTIQATDKTGNTVQTTVVVTVPAAG
jgi:cyclophilin family peptidyl-prolyl cis-trans isomerase